MVRKTPKVYGKPMNAIVAHPSWVSARKRKKLKTAAERKRIALTSQFFLRDTKTAILE